MVFFEEEEKKRKIAELGLLAAKKRLSPQTGYVHYCIEDPYNVRQDTIPVFENFLYAYTLLRTRSFESMQEGKGLLEKLLLFEVLGNFPVYLHEYPYCRDSQHSSLFLPLLFYLIQDFALALGEAVLEKIKGLAERILAYLMQMEGRLSTVAKNRMLAFLGEFDQEKWEPTSPSEWADFCICSQMLKQSLARVIEAWSPKFSVFIGKCQERSLEKREPAVTLLDLMMGELTGAFSARACGNHPVQLRACLIQPYLQGDIVWPKERGYVALVEEGRRQCFTLYFGGVDHTHSLVLEAKKGKWSLLSAEDGVFTWLYAFDEVLPLEEEAVEWACYLALSEELNLLVEGKKATVIQPKEAIQILSPSLEIQIQFQQESSSGTWMGHISQSNRSFQKSKDPYEAYDWKIGCRTIKREPVAFMKVKIEIKERKFP